LCGGDVNVLVVALVLHLRPPRVPRSARSVVGADAALGSRMPRSARPMLRQPPRLAAACRVGRHARWLGQLPRVTAACRVGRPVWSSGQLMSGGAASQARRWPPNPPMQRTRVAPRDRADFRAWFRAQRRSDPDGAPLMGNPLGAIVGTDGGRCRLG
jgi:hypothetical protein